MSRPPDENKMCGSARGMLIQGLLDSGEVWSMKEATDLFFGITKLFQHKDVWSRKNCADE
jgi:hypothetical protein